MPKLAAGGYHTWNEDDIAQFEARHPIGTKARLAFALLLFSAQRRADVIKLGRGNIRGNAIELVQQKTGTPLLLPIHPTLAEIIAKTKVLGIATFLTTARGVAFTPIGFSGWFSDKVAEAGLSGLSGHGLRKSCVVRLAEAGCSASLIGAVTGHRTLGEIDRYVKAASQARMARDAMARI